MSAGGFGTRLERLAAFVSGRDELFAKSLVYRYAIVADQFVEKEQYRYHFAGALAGWFNGQKKYEAAAKFWRMALQATADKQQKAFAQLYLAEALQKTGNTKLAHEELISIDEKLFPGTHRKRYNELKKELAQAPE